MFYRLLVFCSFVLAACGSSEPRLAISETRPIEDQHKRTVGFLDAGVWISNEFDGGRVSDAWQEGVDSFVVQVQINGAGANVRLAAQAPADFNSCLLVKRLFLFSMGHSQWENVSLWDTQTYTAKASCRDVRNRIEYGAT